MNNQQNSQILQYFRDKKPDTFQFIDYFLQELTSKEVTEKLQELNFSDTDIHLNFDEHDELNDIYISTKYYNILIDISVLRNRTYVSQFYPDPDTNRTYTETESSAEGTLEPNKSICDYIVSMRKFLETRSFIDKNYEQHRNPHPKQYTRFNPAAVGPLLIIFGVIFPPAMYFSHDSKEHNLWIVLICSLLSLVVGIIFCIITHRKSKKKKNGKR